MNYLNVLKEIRSLGCSNEARTAAAGQVYLELCEAKKKPNVKYHYEATLDLIYLTATDENITNAIEIYLPVTSCEAINLIQMESVQKTLLEVCKSDAAVAEHSFEFILAIVDPNTTVAMYRVTQNIATLDSLRTDSNL